MARRVEVEIVGNAASLERAFGRARASAGGFERGVMALNKAAGVALAGSLIYAGKTAIDFDRSMRNVNSIAKVSESQFKALERQTLALAGPTGQAPKVLAEGLYDIVSSGFKANSGLRILRASARAATAGLTDTATSTHAIVAALNAYHLSANQASRVSDILFQTVNKGVLTFEELSQNIGDVLPAASTLKVPLTEVGGALATITLHGVNAAEASTQVKQLMVSMLKPSVDLQKAFKAMGYESGQAALEQLGFTGVIRELSKQAQGNNKLIASWFPNVRALGGYFGLAGKNLEQFVSNVDAMGKRGSTAKAFAEQSKSIGVQWQKAKAEIAAAAVPLGEVFFPLLSKAAHAAEGMANALEGHMPQIRSDFESIGHIIGPLATGFGHIALSQPGIAAIAGSLAAIETAAVGMKLKRLGTGLGELGPIGVAAAVGIGIFTAAIILSGGHADVLTQAVNRARDAVEGLANTASTAADKHLALRQAQVNVKTSADAVRQAEEAYQATLHKSGRTSDDTRVALHNLQAARVAHAQALHDEQRAAQQNSAAQVHNANQIRAAKTQVAGLASAFRDAIANADPLTARSLAIGQHMGSASVQAEKFSRGMLHVANEAGAAAGKLSGINANAARVARQLQLAAKTASALAIALGRIPSRKEINVFIRTFEVGKQHTIGGRVIGRQAGGFIPGSGPVPITAHGGEIVLNPDQQQVLGGPRHLAQLFGFHGSRGPGSSMAAGGRVAHGHRAPHLPSSIREAEAKAAGTPSLADDISAYSRELAWTNEQLGRRDLTGSERERLRVRRIRVQNRLGSLRRRQKVQNRRRSSDINLPSSIRLAEARARLTGTLDDDITAKGREVAWYQSELAKRPGRERRIALTNALADALDEYKSLLSEREAARKGDGGDTGGGVDDTADLQARLDQTTARLAAANEAARLQAAFIGTGVFASQAGGAFGPAGAQQIIVMPSLLTDLDHIQRATGLVAQGAGMQPYRSSSVVRTGY